MLSLIPFLLCTWLTQAATPPAEDPRPLPELSSFLQGIRKHLHSDRILQSQYTYLEQTTVQQLDSGGKVKKTQVSLFEVYPAPEEHRTYRKLISKDGKPLSAEEIDKRDRAYEKKSEERQRQLEKESADDRRRREAREAEERRKEEETLDEAFRLYKITMLGRELREGLPVIALAFEPRAGYQPKNLQAKVLSKIRGRAWFGEADQELMRVEAELGDTLSFGLGVVVRLNRGSHIVSQRRRVNSEIWLPAETHFSGTGRVLVFKGFRVDVETVYSDYKKFSVETSISYDREKKP